MTKVWYLNNQIIDIISKMQARPISPDLRYTWFQEPARFEDALGRVIPIPSEYNWGVSSRVQALNTCCAEVVLL